MQNDERKIRHDALINGTNYVPEKIDDTTDSIVLICYVGIISLIMLIVANIFWKMNNIRKNKSTMNILDQANKIVNNRSEEKERMYGNFDNGMDFAMTSIVLACCKS